MTKRFIMLMLVCMLVFIAFISCGDKNPLACENNRHDGRVVAQVNGIVRDANTTEPISGATVTWVDKGRIQTARTDANGVFGAPNLSPGRYRFTVRLGNNHAHITQEIIVPNLTDPLVGGIINIPAGANFHWNIPQDFMLPQLSSTIRGYVYAQTTYHTKVPLGNVRVVAEITGNLVQTRYYATTDENGLYSFENFPSIDTNATISVLGDYMIEGYLYSSLLVPTTRTVAPIFGQVSQMPNNFVLTRRTQTVMIISQTGESYKLGDDIILTFDRDIDTESVTITSSGFDIKAERWSSTTRVVITPEDFLYRLAFNYTITITGLTKVKDGIREEPSNFTLVYSFRPPANVIEIGKVLGDGHLYQPGDAILITFEDKIIPAQLIVTDVLHGFDLWWQVLSDYQIRVVPDGVNLSQETDYRFRIRGITEQEDGLWRFDVLYDFTTPTFGP